MAKERDARFARASRSSGIDPRSAAAAPGARRSCAGAPRTCPASSQRLHHVRQPRPRHRARNKEILVRPIPGDQRPRESADQARNGDRHPRDQRPPALREPPQLVQRARRARLDRQPRLVTPDVPRQFRNRRVPALGGTSQAPSPRSSRGPPEGAPDRAQSRRRARPDHPQHLVHRLAHGLQRGAAREQLVEDAPQRVDVRPSCPRCSCPPPPAPGSCTPACRRAAPATR